MLSSGTDSFTEIGMENIFLEFDYDTLKKYYEYYFEIHKKAHKPPIAHPYHESINTWMIMKRPMMNALKQKWKDFIVWYISTAGYSNLRIEQCELGFKTFYSSHRRHDTDNSTPKFIIDGLCESGFIIDDDCDHIRKLTLECFVDAERPRTEIYVTGIVAGTQDDGQSQEPKENK